MDLIFVGLFSINFVANIAIIIWYIIDFKWQTAWAIPIHLLVSFVWLWFILYIQEHPPKNFYLILRNILARLYDLVDSRAFSELCTEQYIETKKVFICPIFKCYLYFDKKSKNG